MSRSFLIPLALLFALSACSDTREFMGLTNTPPDEFAVVEHPPLSLPPDYSLRPPRPGAPAPREQNPSGMAAKALYGEGNMELVEQQGVDRLKMSNLSPGEQAVVASAGAQQADPNIRNLIDREQGQQVVGNRKLVDALLFWREPKPEDQSTIVNASAEKDRLLAAKINNAPVTSGDTPAVERGKDLMIP
jgi:hypothetical protein